MEEVKIAIDWYSLIDTSLKIGLSSIITGIVTYKITSRNHYHEIKKMEKNYEIKISEDKRNKKFMYFEEALHEVELLINATRKLSEYWRFSKKEIFLKDLDKHSREQYLIASKQYIISRESSLKVTRNFRILKLTNILDTVASIDEIFKNRNNEIVLNKQSLYTDEKLFIELTELLELYHLQVQEAFDKLT